MLKGIKTMEYTIVFDVSDTGFRHWWFPVVGLVFVGVGVVLMRVRRHLPRVHRWFPIVLLAIAIPWTVFAFLGTLAGYWGLASALRDGRCEVVEGVVSDFHPMPRGGHSTESFVVEGRRFEYSDFNLSAGFNNAASHGGPIRNGVRVRIHHLGNDIARLEVAR